jgi:dipeptidase D
MNHILSGIEPTEIWDHFYQLTQIPHPSGGEKEICKYIYRLAENLGMEVTMDTAGGSDFGNVLVKCPPSPGCEKAPITIFQSHLDMVALPKINKDLPLDLILDGSMLRARGNTLGADNCIAVAMALSLMTNPDIVHGPLELLFTINEEAGMTGVRMLSDRILAGSFLINIDTQQEGILTVASAGANRSIFQLPVKMEAKTADFVAVRVSVVGGKGGHSGLEINSGRANVGQLLVRILYEESKTISLCLNEVNWGSVENAIPSEAHAVALIRSGDLVGLRDALQKWEKTFVAEFGKSDGPHRIMLAEDIQQPEFAMGTTMTKNVFSFLLALPHGVYTMSSEVAGLVETSANVAIVRTSPTELTVNVSQRSMSDPSLDAITVRCEAAANLAGAEVSHMGKTYGWKPNMASPLLKICRHAYQQVFGEEPKILGLHGMLECGLIKTKYPHIDMISFGPTILDAHAPTKPDFVPGVDSDSTGERIDIARMPCFWEFVKTVLKKLADLDINRTVDGTVL